MDGDDEDLNGMVVTILEAFLHDGTDELYYAVKIEYDDGEDEEVDVPARNLKFVEAPYKQDGYMDRESTNQALEGWETR